MVHVYVYTVTVTWNGTAITGPVLIFQDELVRDDRTNVLATPVDGTVICRSENQVQVGWHSATLSSLNMDHYYPQEVPLITSDRGEQVPVQLPVCLG